MSANERAALLASCLSCYCSKWSKSKGNNNCVVAKHTCARKPPPVRMWFRKLFYRKPFLSLLLLLKQLVLFPFSFHTTISRFFLARNYVPNFPFLLAARPDLVPYSSHVRLLPSTSTYVTTIDFLAIQIGRYVAEE